MKLYIMRHGEAEQHAQSDFSRPLTEGGRQAVADSAQMLSQGPHQPELILASPLVRAQQTAGIAQSILGNDLVVHTEEMITPSGKPQQVAQQLSATFESQCCLLVSHQPFVSMFLYYLTGEEAFIDTSAIACIDFEVMSPDCGVLEWLRKPY